MRRFLLLLGFLVLACPGQDDDDSTEFTDPDTPFVPCTSWALASSLGVVEDSGLNEISGLVVSRRNPGIFWVHEDSGDDAVLTALDRTGATHATLVLDGVDPVDHEDLALGNCGDGSGETCLVVGDFGDNAGVRDSVTLWRLPEPDLSMTLPGIELEGTPEQLRYQYPEGAQNAEAVVLEPDGSPVVMTKRTDGDSRIYRLPAVGWDATADAELVASITMGSDGGLLDAVTAADLSSDGERLLIRTYTYARHYDLSEVGLDGIVEAPTRQMLPALEQQGEAIAWDDDERGVLTIGEQENATVWHMECSSPQ